MHQLPTTTGGCCSISKINDLVDLRGLIILKEGDEFIPYHQKCSRNEDSENSLGQTRKNQGTENNLNQRNAWLQLPRTRKKPQGTVQFIAKKETASALERGGRRGGASSLAAHRARSGRA